MNTFFKQFLLSILLLFAIQKAAYSMEIAITVDDLPAAGEIPADITRLDLAKQMLAVFKKHHIQGVYGFINGSRATDKNTEQVLQEWVKQGNFLGNHTFTHLDLTKVSADQFISDVQKNEPLLKKLMPSKNFRYFRYPYLAEGNTQDKRDRVRGFLFENHYQIAPVTVDFFEYEWNEPYVRCLRKNDQKSISWLEKNYLQQALNALVISHTLSKQLFNRDIKNILLIHINTMTTHMLDQLLTAYENKGVKFITLPEAFNDEVYRLNPNVVRDRTYTLLNQIRVSRGLKNPPLVTKLYDSLPEDRLNNLCKMTD